MVKQVQQDLPVCRHPDSSRAYLVSGHDRISEAYRYRRNPSCQGMVPHSALVWTSTRRSTGPGGVPPGRLVGPSKGGGIGPGGGGIKMTLGLADPREKGNRLRQM